ncbi:MAG: ABC transporter permease subunit [Verrucomicrobia bacterium]|nr:ABC transporter permease subunit [Verrucomicrobiota bacterium]
MIIRQPIASLTRVALGVLSLLLLLLAYTWLSHRQHRLNPHDTTIPTWSQLAEGARAMCVPDKRTGERWLVEDAKASGTRFFLGLLAGALGAVVLGLLMGCYTPIEAFCSPPLSFLAKVPATAAMAVFFALVGTDLNMYVAIIAFGILPTLALTVYLAVKEFPDELQYKAFTLGASSFEVVYPMIFRYVLPKVIDALRLMIGPALVYLIAAEMLVGDVGFGYRIRLLSRRTEMSVVYFYLTLLAGFGFGMDYFLRWLQRKWCPWFEPRRE